MDTAGCAHCRPPAERARLDATQKLIEARGGGATTREIAVDPDFELGPAAIARYSGGNCTGRCDSPIVVGDTIRLTGRGWAHDTCT
jgi:hypothetical protein